MLDGGAVQPTTDCPRRNLVDPCESADPPDEPEESSQLFAGQKVKGFRSERRVQAASPRHDRECVRERKAMLRGDVEGQVDYNLLVCAQRDKASQQT